jgi:hypothetical protein
MIAMCVLCIFAVCFFVPITSQVEFVRVELRLRVTDSNTGHPIPGAVIMLLNARDNEAETVSVLTDHQGFGRLSSYFRASVSHSIIGIRRTMGISFGAWIIRISAHSYEDYEANLHSPASAELRKNNADIVIVVDPYLNDYIDVRLQSKQGDKIEADRDLNCSADNLDCRDDHHVTRGQRGQDCCWPDGSPFGQPCGG